MDGDDNVTLHIEVCQKAESRLLPDKIQKDLENYLLEQKDLVLDSLLWDTVLPLHIKYVRICCSREEKHKINFSMENVNKCYHIYQIWDEGPEVDFLEEDGNEVPFSRNWCLPNSAFEGLWESLILENGVKEQLMSYVETTLLYSHKQINAQIINWNGIVLLHGPPGTGKTSLSKALAQKLSIRLDSKYKSSQLVEINSHSLFSKWFSESPKLVIKMFESVKQLLQSNDHFVCILLDEVESLTHLRQAKGTDPSDSIRVVNSVLSQIDQLQRYSNVLILATSNITNTIDTAFADRADLKLYIPYPSKWGVYEILRTCIEELIHHGLVKGNPNDFFEAIIFKHIMSRAVEEDFFIMTEIMQNSKLLLDVSCLSEGFSGRTMRKIPFLTSTKFINRSNPNISDFLKVMKEVVDRQKNDNDLFFSYK